MRGRLVLILGLLLLVASQGRTQPPARTYENSLVLAPHYVAYTTDTDAEFARQAVELKRRIGTASHVLLGFTASLPINFPKADIRQPLTLADMTSTLELIDRIVGRAETNGIIVHISILSGFFHGSNSLRQSAIEQDVRNAQWFSDGWIADPKLIRNDAGVPSSAWITPSRLASPLRARMEEGARIVGAHLALRMMQHPETLVTISGDGEVELSYERSIDQGERIVAGTGPIYADYSPFMVEEFRDWIIRNRYEGDLSPATDDNRDGHTFNRDFRQKLTTWRLRYFNASGPIPFSTYARLPEKLPIQGPYFIDGGFDAPRTSREGDPFWDSWMEFRKQAVANYVRDFATWITTSPDRATGFRIPASRFYSHQIPADFLFGEKNGLRLKTSASGIDTAMIAPVGSVGVTAFNTFDGQKHMKTATPALFSALAAATGNWGIFEYNPSIPASPDATYYLQELRTLYSFRPHVIVPFAWSDAPEHSRFNIRNGAFEAALKNFVAEAGDTPWATTGSSPVLPRPRNDR